MDNNDRKKSSHGRRRLLVLCAITAVPALLCSTSMALTPDGEALLELKLAFNATTQRLTSWRPTDPNPCGWEGISCSFPDLRVQSINLPYMQLGGIISPSIGKLDKLQRLKSLKKLMQSSSVTQLSDRMRALLNYKAPEFQESEIITE